MIKNLIFYFLIGGLYLIFITAISLHVKKDKNKRKAFYWEFIFINGIQFCAGLFWMYVIDIQSNTSIMKGLIINTIIAYAIIIEVPIYYLLNEYDKKLINILSSIRSNLISLNYDYNKLIDIREIIKENKIILDNMPLYTLLLDFIDLCERVKNYDKNMLHIMIEEVNLNINMIQSLEKHPFPELIKIISLTGISFLLAELYHLVFNAK